MTADEAPRRSIVRAGALTVLLGALARKDKKSRHPQIVVGGPEVDAVCELVSQLAQLGREDDDAVQQIRAAARGRTRFIERALAMGRMGPPDEEDGLFDYPEGDRAERLLVAAIANAPVQPVSAEQVAWFRGIDALEAGGNEAAYARLRPLIPGLEGLERDVRAHLDAQSSYYAAASLDNDRWSEVCGQLDALFGAEANRSDPILRSGTAYGIAHTYLGNLAGVFDTD